VKKDRFNITVLGAGSWGITLGNLLYENGHKVKLWEFNPEQALKLQKERTFVSLKGFKLPEEIGITSSIEEAVTGADYVIAAVPSSSIEDVAKSLTKISIPASVKFVSAVKGFGKKTLQRPSQILRESLGKKNHIAVLSGPSHAEEVINKVPTAVVCASSNEKVSRDVQKLFSNVYFRVYTSTDLTGVELGGALKNVIAIASGIATGLGMGDNTKAALITRGAVEMNRLGSRMGARKNTFNGLSGIGDLIVTCFSEHSRNFKFGFMIGEGLGFDEAFAKMETTVEGIDTARSVMKLSKKYDTHMPVCEKVYQVLFNKKSSKEAWKELMLRPLKSEDIND